MTLRKLASLESEGQSYRVSISMTSILRPRISCKVRERRMSRDSINPLPLRFTRKITLQPRSSRLSLPLDLRQVWLLQVKAFHLLLCSMANSLGGALAISTKGSRHRSKFLRPWSISYWRNNSNTCQPSNLTKVEVNSQYRKVLLCRESHRTCTSWIKISSSSRKAYLASNRLVSHLLARAFRRKTSKPHLRSSHGETSTFRCWITLSSLCSKEDSRISKVSSHA